MQKRFQQQYVREARKGILGSIITKGSFYYSNTVKGDHFYDVLKQQDMALVFIVVCKIKLELQV